MQSQVKFKLCMCGYASGWLYDIIHISNIIYIICVVENEHPTAGFYQQMCNIKIASVEVHQELML